MMGKIVLTYCPNNPGLHRSDLYERLAQDPRFELRSPYCRKLCVTCAQIFYAWIGEKRQDGFIFGRTEEEFIDTLEAATKMDLRDYRDDRAPAIDEQP
ncbi:MAG: hypothetical protein HY517_02180 [Candidatus Aenigmarchaeota archaeon]|nr:hypothetical protein [Candidatus Aenigmarchaeota archaeon]